MTDERRLDFEQDIQQRLVAVEGKFEPIAAQLATIAENQNLLLSEQRLSAKTQWAPLLTALTLIVIIMASLGTLTVAPIKEKQETLTSNLDKLETRTYAEGLQAAREAGRTEAKIENLEERLKEE